MANDAAAYYADMAVRDANLAQYYANRCEQTATLAQYYAGQGMSGAYDGQKSAKSNCRGLRPDDRKKCLDRRNASRYYDGETSHDDLRCDGNQFIRSGNKCYDPKIVEEPTAEGCREGWKNLCLEHSHDVSPGPR